MPMVFFHRLPSAAEPFDRQNARSQETAAGGRVEIFRLALQPENTTRFLTAEQAGAGRRGKGTPKGATTTHPWEFQVPTPKTNFSMPRKASKIKALRKRRGWNTILQLFIAPQKKSALPRLDRADGFSYNTAIASSVCRHLERLPEGAL